MMNEEMIQMNYLIFKNLFNNLLMLRRSMSDIADLKQRVDDQAAVVGALELLKDQGTSKTDSESLNRYESIKNALVTSTQLRKMVDEQLDMDSTSLDCLVIDISSNGLQAGYARSLQDPAHKLYPIDIGTLITRESQSQSGLKKSYDDFLNANDTLLQEINSDFKKAMTLANSIELQKHIEYSYSLSIDIVTVYGQSDNDKQLVLNMLNQLFRTQYTLKNMNSRDQLLDLLAAYRNEREKDTRDYITLFGAVGGYHRIEKLGAVDALVEVIHGKKNTLSDHELNICRQGRLGSRIRAWEKETGMRLDELFSVTPHQPQAPSPN